MPLPVLAKKANGDCVFLVDDNCSIHDVKPLQCRNSPFVSSLIVNKKDWDEFHRTCPGFRERSFVSIDEIVKGLNQESVENRETYRVLRNLDAENEDCLPDCI